MFFTPAYAQDAAGGAGNPLIQFAPFILIFVIMYFLIIRPQQKKMKEHREMISAIRRGESRSLDSNALVIHDSRSRVVQD